MSGKDEKKKRLKEIVKENDNMNECAQELVKEGLVVSMSEGRRAYTQLKDVFDGK